MTKITPLRGVLLALCVLAGVVGVAFGFVGHSGEGRLQGANVKGHLGLAYTLSQPGKPVSMMLLNVCSDHRLVRLLAVQPIRTVGQIRLDRVGLSPPYPISAHMAPTPGIHALPASWTLGGSVVSCASQRQIVAAQATRLGAGSGGFIGFRFVYLDEKGSKHSVTTPGLTYGLCGSTKELAVDCAGGRQAVT